MNVSKLMLTAASMIKNNYISHTESVLPIWKPMKAAISGPNATDHEGHNNLIKEFMLFGNGVAGSYLSHSLRSLLFFNSLVGCQHAYLTWMLYGGSMAAGAAMPVALSFFIKCKFCSNISITAIL